MTTPGRATGWRLSHFSVRSAKRPNRMAFASPVMSSIRRLCRQLFAAAARVADYNGDALVRADDATGGQDVSGTARCPARSGRIMSKRQGREPCGGIRGLARSRRVARSRGSTSALRGRSSAASGRDRGSRETRQDVGHRGRATACRARRLAGGFWRPAEIQQRASAVGPAPASRAMAGCGSNARERGIHRHERMTQSASADRRPTRATPTVVRGRS
jgi:hypothetical protein